MPPGPPTGEVMGNIGEKVEVRFPRERPPAPPPPPLWVEDPITDFIRLVEALPFSSTSESQSLGEIKGKLFFSKQHCQKSSNLK